MLLAALVCGPLSAAKPAGLAREETLRVGVGIRPDTLELYQVTSSAVANLLEHIVETLVGIDENGQIVPRLAERWDVSADGLQYTFYLAKGVTFQDGTPLDAKAVVWNVNRLIDSTHAKADEILVECPVDATLAATQSVEAVDPGTVHFTLKHRVPNFLATLSWVAYGILSPGSESLPGNRRYNIQHPVGTGPFVFESLSADGLRLKRFDGYRGERPYFSRLEFKFITSPQEREKGLADKELDVILLPNARHISGLAKDARYGVLAKPSTRTIFVNLNNQKAPFNDARVRRAVNLAIDKQAIVDEVLQGNAVLMDAPIAPSIFGYCSVGSYNYDPEVARALLAEAKVAPGTRLTMLTPRGRYLEDEAVAQRIAGYLREVGFAVTVEPLDWPALMGALYRPPEMVTADMHLFGWAPTFADAAWQLPQLYDSKEWPPYGPASSFYKNPEVDRLLDLAVAEPSPGARRDLFCSAEQLIWNDAPAVFLWVQNFPVAYRAGLTNIQWLPNEKVSVAFARPTTPGAGEKPTQKPARGKARMR